MSMVSEKLTVKLFAGIFLTSEIRLHLKQSFAWKLVSMNPDKTILRLVETHYKSQDFIGFFLPEPSTTIDQLRQAERFVLTTFHSYCPEIALESLSLIIFPQVFIA